MPLVLICSLDPLADELKDTVLWREGMERRQVTNWEQATAVAQQSHPAAVLVDRDLPRAAELIATLRRGAATRTLSIAVVSRGDLDPIEVEMLTGGANAILRIPPGPEWDERLPLLLSVAARRVVRLPVHLELEARNQAGVEQAVGTALNLSIRGMLLECGFRLEVGDILDLRFRLPDASEPIVGCARVVRRAGHRRFGIEFFGLEGDGDERVERYVASVS